MSSSRSSQTVQSSVPEEDIPVTTAVIEAVSSSSGKSMLDLPSLNEVIDTDALDTLFTGNRTNGKVEFRYAGHDVTVHADRTIEVKRDN